MHGHSLHTWSDFDPGFSALVRDAFPDLPAAAVALSLRVWGRMHGLVSLEVYGHLQPQSLDPAKLYLEEMLDLAASLGLAVAGSKTGADEVAGGGVADADGAGRADTARPAPGG
jgi:hypothetical protein